MISIHQKNQILESLNSMDAEQTEKVLTYIRRVSNVPARQTSYERFKRQAMVEIRQALSKKSE